MKHSAFSVAFLALFMLPTPGQGSSNVTQLAQNPYPIGTTSEVWGSNDLAIVSRRNDGFTILDVSDPANPIERFSGHAELFVRDAKTFGNILACTNESGNGQGVYLYDISDPTNPQTLSSFGSFALPTSYNLQFSPDGLYLYCCSFLANRVVILDISNPALPVQLGFIASQALVSQIHDVAVVDGKLYVSWLSGGFEIHDLANPAAPTLVAWHQIPTSFVHNCWPLPGGLHVATTDELSGGYLTIWNVQNPGAITQVSQWRTSPVAVMHNVLIKDHLAYVTNYTEGLRIIDVQDPMNPVEVGFFDSFPGVTPFAFGAWGVYPFDAERLYLADFDTGFYSLRFTPVTMTVVPQNPVVAWGQTIVLDLGVANQTLSAQPMIGALDVAVQELGPQFFPVLSLPLVVPATAAGTLSYPIPLPPGGGTFHLDFSLRAITISGATLLGSDNAFVTIQ